MTDRSLPTVYDPKAVEQKWYRYWMERGYFGAKPDPARPKYCITIPPPNVTGSLHIGHALCYTIQDVLVRWKRMQGFNTLCLPGTDHAGIGTQTKVEEHIAGEGLTRQDLGREKFLERVWAWKEKYGGEIISQFKTMGFSFDWSRERFTMDEGYTDAVLEAFVRLFEKGYIYRGTRVINWCPRCRTAISDIEVEYVEQHSYLWHIRYPLEDGSGYVVVATTRPETMLGDTAVAVNPNDGRYAGLVGKTVILPLVDRRIPVVADEYVDREFGTGAVKVTPAHDPNDFEIGLRHNLPQVIVIGPDGSMTADAGSRYEGLDRFEARKLVVKDLEDRALMERAEDYTHSVGAHGRCHTVIEPLLSEQWFCRMKELAQPAIDVVKTGKVRFHPERYARIYIEWMENVKDWCISRQLWWGHRIPVWKCDACGEYTAAKAKLDSCSRCGSSSVSQDPDVLDTWFSSALWPFATLGWPQETPELDYFYPTDVLVTARDIIYLWVARMIFTSLEFLGKVPFDDVHIYATVMNEEGRRMSKSLGTGVDPVDLISRFGADALRFALILQAGDNQDIRFSDKRVENVRNFANKVWNASRFVIMNLDGFGGSDLSERGLLRLEDRWILSRLNRVASLVNDSLARYAMDDATRALYEFTWNEFCDWYIELAKPRLKAGGEERKRVQSILSHVLESVMRLLHPVMPFITEEIWQALPHEGDSIMLAQFPAADDKMFDDAAESEMQMLIDGVKVQRELKASSGIAFKNRAGVLLVGSSEPGLTDEQREFLESTAVTSIACVDAPPADTGRYRAGVAPGLGTFYLEVPEVDLEKEAAKLRADLESVSKDLERTLGKLSNPQFVAKAPAEVVQKEERIRGELEERKRKLEEQLSRLG